MLQVRRSGERGFFDHGWLQTYHSFSFGDYYDTAHMGFRQLRVINEDYVQPNRGFGTHPHRDMEIVTYIISGALEHKDSMGNGSVIRTGEVQRMTAGTGVTHSEFNPSPNEAVHLLQIWILPERKGLEPSYEQKSFTKEKKLNRLCLLASNDGREHSVTVHQDVALFGACLDAEKTVLCALNPKRFTWVQVVHGEVNLKGVSLHAGDGAALSDEEEFRLQGVSAAEVLVFDLA